jgi:hypothetical protein
LIWRVLEERGLVGACAYVEELRQVGGCGDCGHDDEVGSGGGGESRSEECEFHDCWCLLRSGLSL